ncbi:MAG: M20/M25/M40 family metallo-hydrolase [Armatimonadota bacterium]
MVDEKRLVESFLSLAAVNSPTCSEKVIADILEVELEALGFSVVRDSAGESIGSDTGNLIATKKGSVPGVPILFSAHMDTVAPTEDWSHAIRDGVIYSGGETILGADDKAGIAAILEAMRTLRDEGIPHADIQIVFSIAEETGLYGAKQMDYGLITSRCAFVYDMGTPTGCVTVAAPWHDNIIAKIQGKAAHSGARPEDGISAVVTASRAISRMNLGRIDRETTANIGTIHGGTARNIVPDLCEVKGEARSRDPEKLAAQVRHMVECFQEAASEMGARADITIDRSYDGYRLSEDDEVVRIAVDAARRVGIEPERHETGGGSDANVMNARGIPSTVIGVGYDNPHSVEERQSIADLVKAAQMAVAIVRVAATPSL